MMVWNFILGNREEEVRIWEDGSSYTDIDI